MKLKVKVVPGASTNEVVGWLGDKLKVRVTAAPEKSKANDAVIKTIARQLAVSIDNIEVVSGKTSPNKVVLVDMDAALILGRLPERTIDS